MPQAIDPSGSLKIGTAEKWRMTEAECQKAVLAAYENCPKKHWRELEVGEIVISDRRNALIVVKAYPVRKPILNGITKEGEPTGVKVDVNQEDYKVATPDLLQYAGKSHEDSVIDALLEGLPVPSEIVGSLADKVRGRIGSDKHCVVTWFSTVLTMGRSAPFCDADILPQGYRTNAENYQALMDNPKLEELKAGFKDWESAIAKQVMDRVERYEKFLRAASPEGLN